MLVQFCVENYKSFRDRITFVMAAQKEKIHPEHLTERNGKASLQVQRIAALYGANASGKSNFIEAAAFLKDLVVNGRGLDELVMRDFFAGNKTHGQTARFEVDILLDQELVRFGLELSKKRVEREWLQTGNGKLLYERVTNEKGELELKLSKVLEYKDRDDKDLIKLLIKSTRGNQLLLHQLATNNVKTFNDLFLWFRNSLNIVRPNQKLKDVVFLAKNDKNMRDLLISLLSGADTGIKNLFITEKKINIDSMEGENFLKVFQGRRLGVGNINEDFEIMQDDDGVIKGLSLKLTHGLDDETNQSFSDVTESDGTSRLLDLAACLYHMRYTKDECVYLIDELDRSLHPLVFEFYLDYYLKLTVKKRSQLIFTTHQTEFLSLKRFRRGEIWFFEKDPQQISRLFSLYEFKSTARFDKDIKKAYLDGRYGGGPNLEKMWEALNVSIEI